ncbi:MAG: sigma-70 family RNA polymerase sigma factor [Acidobacteriia bacterium]|nr:sigma-70 family RNA polymerase sigma factor [Terriglobia bacterium]
MKPTIATQRVEPPPVSDEMLVERTAQGDVRAFEELIERYQDPALRVAFRFVGDPQEAEDLVQETFLRVYRNAHRYNYSARFRSWFFQILINLCRDWLKKKKPFLFGDPPLVARSEPDPSEAIDRERRAMVIRRAIQSLPPNQTLALILCHYEEMSYREASAVLETSEKAIESLLVRARRTLRTRLAELR